MLDGMSRGFSNVLVPVDFGEVSEHALRYALGMAREGGTVHVLHVYTIPVYGVVPDGGFVASPETAVRLSEAAQQGLARLVEAHKGDGVRLVPVLREGVAATEVVEVAKEIGADLIVIGTHGRRGIAHALLGSTAESVVRRATVPVLTVKLDAPAGG
jgi:nucleotide-binding universal stress UspA family protein